MFLLMPASIENVILNRMSSLAKDKEKRGKTERRSKCCKNRQKVKKKELPRFLPRVRFSILRCFSGLCPNRGCKLQQ